MGHVTHPGGDGRREVEGGDEGEKGGGGKSCGNVWDSSCMYRHTHTQTVTNTHSLSLSHTHTHMHACTHMHVLE